MRSELNGDNFGCITFKESLVGEPPWFGDTHAHHAHAHDSMYIHVYTCTHCGRKGHLVKFYYDRIHTSNLQISLFGLGKVLTPMDPIRYGY